MEKKGLNPALEDLIRMARQNRKPDPGPDAGEFGTGQVTEELIVNIVDLTEPDGLSLRRKVCNFGLAEYARGGPASRNSTREEDLRDFNSK